MADKQRAKRTYKGNFNPYTGMQFANGSCQVGGAGTRVLIIGHSSFFAKETIRAWFQVREDLKLETKMEGNSCTTEKGVTFTFVKIPDNHLGRGSFVRNEAQSQVIILCDEYNSPEFLNLIRETNRTKQMYSIARNNTSK